MRGATVLEGFGVFDKAVRFRRNVVVRRDLHRGDWRFASLH
mgnify:CR=1 FL=1